MGKIRIVECLMCGEKFETTSSNAKRCPDCRDKVEYRPGTPSDEEYAALGVPVTTHVASNGMVVETRGQARISSSCGITPAMDSAIARKYL